MELTADYITNASIWSLSKPRILPLCSAFPVPRYVIASGLVKMHFL